MLSRKLAQLKAEKAVGLPINSSLVNEKTLEELHICQIIMQKSKSTVPFVKPYSGLYYGQYQSFVRECEHLLQTKPITYRKNVDKVLYHIDALEGTLFTTWYRYKEKLGWMDIGLDALKTFLLDDLFPLEIRLRDVHQKYREEKQRPGQTGHALIRYLEELEMQMVPVTKDHQMSTIFGDLYLWIEIQVSSHL